MTVLGRELAPPLLVLSYHPSKIMSKYYSIIVIVTSVLACFTAWNFSDFFKRKKHSTAAYIAIIFNLYAILHWVVFLLKEVIK